MDGISYMLWFAISLFQFISQVHIHQHKIYAPLQILLVRVTGHH